MDTWLKMFSPIMDVRLPASGDVSMDYQPWTNWGRVSVDAGTPEVEFEVFRNVALPGKQLGKLIDAVNVLIELADTDAIESLAESDEKKEALTNLTQLAGKIEAKKEELKQSAEAVAKKSLERFARTSEDYRSRVDEMCRQIDEATEESRREQ